MSSITFDTLAYAKKLREGGFTEEQAEAQYSGTETSARTEDSGHNTCDPKQILIVWQRLARKRYQAGLKNK